MIAKTRDNQRRRKSKRWWWIGALLVVVLLVVGGWRLQSAALTRLIEPRLERMLGMDATIGRASFASLGRVVVEGVRIEGVGDASGVRSIDAERIEARVNWLSMLRGGGGITNLTLRRPVIRVAHALSDAPAAPGDVVARPGGARIPSALPEIEIIDGSLEFGQVAHDGYSPIITLHGEAELMRRGRAGLYSMRVRQHDAQGRPAFDVAGEINLSSWAVTMGAGGVDLAEWIASCTIEQEEKHWRELIAGGWIKQGSLRYTPEDGVRVELDVDGVQLRIPATGRDDESAGELALDDVSGAITLDNAAVRAELDGLLEGLPTRARFHGDRLSLTSPFRCELEGGPHTIDEGWGVVEIAPRIVHRVLREFSSPIAEVTTRVVLERTAPSSSIGGGVEVFGEAHIEHGSVAFVEFPYPIRELSGVVEFDMERVRLRGLRAESPTGAVLTGSGEIIPDASGVGLDLTITGEKVPVDEAILEAIGGQERVIIEDLFDRARFDALRRRIDLITPDERDELAARAESLSDRLAASAAADEPEADALHDQLASVRERLTRPVFESGGRASVRTRIRREPGSWGKPRVEVDVAFDRAGLVYEFFPYPVVAKPLRVHVDGRGVEVIEATLAGPTGASGEITGSVRLGEGGETTPALRISFDTLPVDAVLLATIGLLDDDEARPVDLTVGAMDRSLAQLLEALSPSGAVRGEARVFSAADGRPTYDVVVDLAGLNLAPDASTDDGGVEVASFHGPLRVDPDGVWVGPATAQVGPSEVGFTIDAPFAEGAPVRASISSDRFELATPVEHLIAAFKQTMADELRALRELVDVRGEVEIDGVFEADDGGASYSFEMRSAGPVALRREGEAVWIEQESGRLRITDERVTAEGVVLTMLHDGAPAGQVEIHGVVWDPDPAACRIEISVRDAIIETPLLRWMAEAVSPRAAEWIDRSDPAGRLNASVVVSKASEGWGVESGWISPSELSFERDGEVVVFNDIAGRITIGPEGGLIDSVVVVSEGWSMRLDGAWYAGETPGVELTLDANADRLTPAITALLPADVRESFRRLEIDVQDGFTLEDATLAVNAPVEGVDIGAGFRDGVRFQGVARCRNASINAGVEFSRINGDVHLSATRAPFARDTLIEVTLDMASVRAAGLTMREVIGAIRSDTSDASLLVIDLLGRSHGGRLWATGEARTGEVGRAGSYRLDLRCVGLDVASAIREVTGVSTPAPPEGDRGYLDASVVIGGELTADDQPRGQGSIRVMGGQLVQLPLVLAMLELGNLLPPVGEELDYASAEFTLGEGLARFDRLIVVSPSITLIGEGVVSVPDFRLDLRFGTAGNFRLPIFSAVVDMLRNELLTTRVRGTLMSPEFSVQQLPGARRMLSRLFGITPGLRSDPPARTTTSGDEPGS